jgi:hypothetical protein
MRTFSSSSPGCSHGPSDPNSTFCGPASRTAFSSRSNQRTRGGVGEEGWAGRMIHADARLAGDAPVVADRIDQPRYAPVRRWRKPGTERSPRWVRSMPVTARYAWMYPFASGDQ